MCASGTDDKKFTYGYFNKKYDALMTVNVQNIAYSHNGVEFACVDDKNRFHFFRNKNFYFDDDRVKKTREPLDLSDIINAAARDEKQKIEVDFSGMY